MRPLLLALLMLLPLLYGCTGGCKGDWECKPGESCVGGSCTLSCARQAEWCEADEECCSGLECNQNACRVIGWGKPVEPEPQENATVNASDQNTTTIFDLNVLDLAEEQSAELNGTRITVKEITNDLVECVAQNQKVHVLVEEQNKSAEFVLSEGEVAEFGAISIKPLRIPITVGENETGCFVKDIVSRFKILGRAEIRSSVSPGDRVLLPDGQSVVDVLDITNLGEVGEYWREFQLRPGESFTVDYPHLGSTSTLFLKAESIEQAAVDLGQHGPCNVTPGRVRLRAKVSGTPELTASASEGETTDIPWHKIKVENISSSIWPSDGESCATYNRKVLLNMSFPKASADYVLLLKLLTTGKTKEVEVSSKSPYSEGDIWIAVLPQATGPQLIAGYRPKKVVLLSENQSAEFEGTTVLFQSLLPRVQESKKSCQFLEAKSRVEINPEDIKKDMEVGEVHMLPGGGSVELLDTSAELEWRLLSCSAVLKRAVLAVSIARQH